MPCPRAALRDNAAQELKKSCGFRCWDLVAKVPEKRMTNEDPKRNCVLFTTRLVSGVTLSEHIEALIDQGLEPDWMQSFGKHYTQRGGAAPG